MERFENICFTKFSKFGSRGHRYGLESHSTKYSTRRSGTPIYPKTVLASLRLAQKRRHWQTRFSNHDDIDRALAAYNAAHLPLSERIVAHGRKLGTQLGVKGFLN